MTKKAFLIILDGWGHGKNPEVSALAKAKTPFINSLYNDYLNSELVTFGEEVGLPKGQMGNSEVGHLNLGAGRVVYQELARINNAISNDTLGSNQQLQKAIKLAKENNKPIHLMGLLSDGGVHSHINHLKALCTILDQAKVKTYIHAFMDGRDTSPNGGKEYMIALIDHIKDMDANLSSMIGRYYAMDRDNRWERIKLTYDLLTKGKGIISNDPIAAIEAQYADNITDEFITPVKFGSLDSGIIQDDDVVLFFNFRTDRPRQLTEVLTQKAIDEEHMSPLNLHYFTMTEYSDAYKNINVLFSKNTIENTIGEVIANAGLTQLRVAETEKYPHVTFFFSGGKEQPFTGEDRILIDSPKVATYDLKPSMSAIEVKDAIIDDIENKSQDFICLNFANTDMVGHTGVMSAAIEAAETVDICLSEIIPIALQKDYNLFVIADHGNADIMQNPDGSAHTAHTTNMVPLIFVSKNQDFTIENGKLGDLAPTILATMGVEIPSEMTGNIILKKKD